MVGANLSTIYSVGEGRTIVFATDGCSLCLKAFSILAASGSTSSAEPQTPPSRPKMSSPMSRRSKDDTHASLVYPGRASGAGITKRDPRELKGGEKKGETSQRKFHDIIEKGLLSNVVKLDKDPKATKVGGIIRSSSDPKQLDFRSSSGERSKTRTSPEPRIPGTPPRGMKSEAKLERRQEPVAMPTTARPLSPDLKGHKKMPRGSLSPNGRPSLKSRAREKVHGCARAVSVPKTREEKTSVTKCSGEPLIIVDPLAGEDGSGEQELTLSRNDRLIVAIYAPPWHANQDEAHTQTHIHLREKLPAAIGGLLKKKAPVKPTSEAKDSKDLAPHAKGQDLATEKEDWDEFDELDQLLTVPKPEPKPQMGPGKTTIFIPFCDTDLALKKWENPNAKESLIEMAKSASKQEVRFEAIELEGYPQIEDPDASGRKTASDSPSTKKDIKSAKSSLSAFCSLVEAKIIVIGPTHTSEHVDLSAAKDFWRRMVVYSTKHCNGSTRVLSSAQLESNNDNLVDNRKHHLRAGLKVVGSKLITNYVRDG